MTMTLESPDLIPPRKHRVTVAEFELMIEAGVFLPDARLELLNGEIIEMSPIGIPHLKCVTRLQKRLERAFGDRAVILSQNPIELPSDGRPQPDFALHSLDVTDDRLALPEDIFLIIEVSDSTLRDDPTTKLADYARDGIKEYWIVNLIHNQLEVYRDPEGERYATTFTVKPGANQACLAFPDEALDWR